MIVQFNNDYLENIYNGNIVNGKLKYSNDIVKRFIKRIDTMKQVDNSIELAKFQSLNLEKLKVDKKDLYSIRVNDQYRLEFKLEMEVIKLIEIAIIDDMTKHYL